MCKEFIELSLCYREEDDVPSLLNLDNNHAETGLLGQVSSHAIIQYTSAQHASKGYYMSTKPSLVEVLTY